MHPLIAYDLAKLKIAEYEREADRDHLAATVREGLRARIGEAAAQPRWFLRRLLLRPSPAPSGG
jgi:hypothetical protein